MKFKQNGTCRIWDTMLGHNSVAILLHNTDTDSFILVKQFRPAVYMSKARELGFLKQGTTTLSTDQVPAKYGVTHEMCAGIVDKDLSLEQIAVEEVLEECGYQVKVEDLEKITTAHGSVGVSGTQNTQFYVQVNSTMKVSEGGGNRTEGEIIDLVEIPVKDSLKFIKDTNYIKPYLVNFAILWFHSVKTLGVDL